MRAERYHRTLLVLAMTGIVACLHPAVPSRAQDDDGVETDGRFTARAVAMLPPYCKYSQLYRDKVPGGNDPERIKYWYSVIGPEFHNVHHYCWGMVHINNANSQPNLSQAQRSELLRYAISELTYVIVRSNPNFVLLPELLTKRAELRIRRGEYMYAPRDLSRAIQLKPDYWPAYAAASDLAKQGGDLAAARDWLEKGLAQSPDSKTLRQKLAELGGSRGNGKASPSGAGKPPAARQTDAPAPPAPQSEPNKEAAPAGQ